MWLQKLTLNSTKAPVNMNLVSAKHCMKDVCRRGTLFKSNLAMGRLPRVALEGSSSSYGEKLRQIRPLQDSGKAFWKRPESRL